jgi:hypothetical protein
MKKLKLNVFLMIAISIGSLIISSCSKEKFISQEQNAKTTFIDVTATNSTSSKKGWWVIADWDWGRESRQCKSGFGVCHWDWFPGWRLVKTPLKDGQVRTPILYDDTLNLHYVEFLLEKDSYKEEYLTIEKDLSMDVTVEEETESITFSAGQYRFDESLGIYGGYRVNAK